MRLPLNCTNLSAPQIRFSATVGQERGIELSCMMVSNLTENKLHFTARLAYEADSPADLHIQLLSSGEIQR